jgi:beta-RFAP synthase
LLNTETEMNPGFVHIVAPSRLHFGLLSVGGTGRQFGGAGVMVETPSTIIDVRQSSGFGVSGPLVSRVQATVESWMDYHRLKQLPDCHITVRQLATQHAGLGSGTQMGLSIVSALNRLTGRRSDDPVALTRAAGRGRRSAVGTYGFLHGGLIVERGRLADEPLAAMQTQIALPEFWRFVLARPLGEIGLSGNVESQAFRDLSNPPTSLRAALSAELQRNLIPAARRGDIESFGESLYRYGRMAGLYFVKTQGGPYNGIRIATLVDELRRRGVAGVGQSSWGPTVFALVSDQEHADRLQEELRREHPENELDLSVCRVSNSGARVEEA